MIIAEHDNTIGLKDSSGNVTKMGAIRKAVSEDFKILAGDAGYLITALVVGAVGGILALANIAPEKCIRMYNDYFSGKMENAQKIPLDVIALNKKSKINL